MENEYIASLRKEYNLKTIDPTDLPDDPVEAFRHWFDLALEEGVNEPNAMVLSTVTAEGRPASRVVLLKDLTSQGLVFFTNYSSRKGKEMETKPFASVNFFWPELERQIRIEGKVVKVSKEISEAYFASRPKLSKAGAIVSSQSSVIESKDAMEKRMEELMQLPEEELHRPENWGGYNIIPDYYEFWQGRPGRLHDRIEYKLNDGVWVKSRLSP